MDLPSQVDEFPEEQWNKVIAINLSSAFFLTQAVLPHMRKQNWGRIVNIASVHGLVASVNKVLGGCVGLRVSKKKICRAQSAYVAAKHGMVGFTKATALETAQTGITVNAVCPGWVRTELIERQIAIKAEAMHSDIETAAQEVCPTVQRTRLYCAMTALCVLRQLLREKQPSLQFVAPDQLADVIAFLTSDSASQITGVALPVDGGWCAQ